MILVITAAALLLAWVSFRYERHRRWRSEIEAAYGALRAAHDGIVQGIPHGIVEGKEDENPPSGWSDLYFGTLYTPEVARARGVAMADVVMQMNYDQIFVVPTEPLARLATLAPQEGLIEPATVAAANEALWRVEVFNQLVRQLTDFYAAYCAEIVDPDTSEGRRKALAEVVWRFSYVIHQQAIGEAAAPGGWYKTFTDALDSNLAALGRLRDRNPPWLAWPYAAGDAIVSVIFIVAVAVTLTSAFSSSDHHRDQGQDHHWHSAS